MTKLAVSIMVRSLDQALEAASCAAKQGADLVEFRIDQFTGPHQQLTELVDRSCLPCIVTCRPTWEGGGYTGDDDDRIRMLEHVTNAQQGPAFIDVELKAYQTSTELKQRVDRIVNHANQTDSIRTNLILSTHDFHGRPDKLCQQVETMATLAVCDVMKIVWQARSLRDNIEAFEILVSRHKPTISLCMGPEGLPSRVLAKKFGAMLTFGALDSSTTTADGQPTIEQLKRLYRWDALKPDTKVYGVIGHPIAHSASPEIHNAGFDATGYNGIYLPMPIAPSYECFKATVITWLDMPQLHFRGASVTLPHKQNLLQFVQSQNGQVEPLAQKIGAANTLTRLEDGRLFASNTDYAAALDVVCNATGMNRSNLRDKRVAVIGAGGVARAIVAGFADCGATIVIYNRTLENAQILADEFNGPSSKIVGASLEKLCDSCCQIFVNCTPIGMHPDIEATPIPNAKQMRHWDKNTLVFDTIYNPANTRLLRDARAANCKTISGAEMFVRQAANQFKLWTGCNAPLELFRTILAEKVSQD